jgi:hypothetical protein
VLKQANGANLAAILASDSWVNNTSTTGDPLVVRDLTIDGNDASNPTAGDALVIRSWHTPVTDWNILDNWIASSGGSGINMDNAAGWVVERNHLYGDGAAGISASRLFASSISDNYIEDFNTSGITATVQGDAASVISGNRIFPFSGSGTLTTRSPAGFSSCRANPG